MSTEPQPKKQKRFIAQRKQEVVLRLLKGESIELLSRELSVPAATLSEWRETFLTRALNGLKSKPKDDRDELSDQNTPLGRWFCWRWLP